MVQSHVRVLLFHCVIIFYCLIVLVADTQQRCVIVMMVGGALPPCILKNGRNEKSLQRKNGTAR